MASTSAQGIQWSALPVRTAIGPHVVRANDLIQNVETAIESLGQAAALLKAAGEEDKVQKVRESAREMLEARESARLQRDALNHLASAAGYQATGAATDFAALLSAKVDQLAASQPYDVADDPLMAQFEELVAENDEEAQEEQIDEDIAIEGGAELAKNTTCPITGKQLLDLEEPVVDAIGFVYEKAAVEDYLRRKGATQPHHQAPCPVAGTSQMISLGELRAARAVLAAKRRGAAGRSQRAPTQRQETAGVVDLE